MKSKKNHGIQIIRGIWITHEIKKKSWTERVHGIQRIDGIKIIVEIRINHEIKKILESK